MNGLMHGAAPTGLVARAVGETLEALAAPKVRAAVIELALRWARLEVMPERGPAVAAFVEGALLHACTQMLGPQMAEAVQDDLAPIVRMVADAEVSAVRPSAPPPDSDYPEIEVERPSQAAPVEGRAARVTAPEPVGLRRVFVATMDPASAAQVSGALTGVALVEPVRDALEVLSSLAGENELVVMDCRRPALSVETLVALAPEMPPGSQVVLWGERGDLEEHLGRLGARMPADWVCCGPAATVDDVAAVARILLH